MSDHETYRGKPVTSERIERMRQELKKANERLHRAGADKAMLLEALELARAVLDSDDVRFRRAHPGSVRDSRGVLLQTIDIQQRIRAAIAKAKNND